nr:MAG TPA: terminase [Caudoviricetes sp.]
MIHTDFVQAVEEQINLCEEHLNYKCGIFVSDKEQYEIALKVISNLLSGYGNVYCSKSKYEAFAKWMNNGSIIKIIYPNEYARGSRYSGAIISNSLDREIVNTLVMPHLIDYRNFRTGIEEFLGIEDDLGDIKERIFTVDITPEDADKSKYNYDIYKSLGISQEAVDAIIEQWMKLANKININDENMEDYVVMGNEYTAPYLKKQNGTGKIYIYKAEGIPRENIEYETEFVNRTKETYLNITGEETIEALDFHNKINVHLFIDTDIYDGYEVHIMNGLVHVILHEIINEQPVLKDMGARNE